MTSVAAYEELGTADVPVVRVPLEGDLRRTLVDAVIISDLHLGSDNCQAKAAASFLQLILDGELPAKRLIINGDVFDSIDFRRLKKTHWKVLSQIRHLSDKIEIIWIAGNHDGSAEIVSHLLGVQVAEEYVLTSGGVRMLVIHGHGFDDFINEHPIITWLADCGYLLLQKIDRTHYVARLAKRRSKIFVRCARKIRDGARAMAARMGCTVAICGHTHHAEAEGAESEPLAETGRHCDPTRNAVEERTRAGVAYYNSGCWTEIPATYLVVDAGRVMLETYEPIRAMAETA